MVSVNSDALVTAFGFYYDYEGVLSTKCGNELLLYSARSDHSAAEKQKIRDELCTTYSAAILMGEATSAYNGHSYALHDQTVSNNRWIFDIDGYINDPHVDVSANGDWDKCDTGDVIVYFDRNGDPVHTGIIYKTNDEGVYVISKWDDKCLFKHEILDVPERFYYDPSISRIRAYAYTVTSHDYSPYTYDSRTHTFKCDVCDLTYSENHVSDGLGNCLYCDYTTLGGLIPVLPVG